MDRVAPFRALSPERWPPRLVALLQAVLDDSEPSARAVLSDELMAMGEPWGEVLAGARAELPAFSGHGARFAVTPADLPRELRLLTGAPLTREDLALLDQPALFGVRRLALAERAMFPLGWERSSQVVAAPRFPSVDELDAVLGPAWAKQACAPRLGQVRTLHLFPVGSAGSSATVWARHATLLEELAGLAPRLERLVLHPAFAAMEWVESMSRGLKGRWLVELWRTPNAFPMRWFGYAAARWRATTPLVAGRDGLGFMRLLRGRRVPWVDGVEGAWVEVVVPRGEERERWLERARFSLDAAGVDLHVVEALGDTPDEARVLEAFTRRPGTPLVGAFGRPLSRAPVPYLPPPVSPLAVTPQLTARGIALPGRDGWARLAQGQMAVVFPRQGPAVAAQLPPGGASESMVDHLGRGEPAQFAGVVEFDRPGRIARVEACEDVYPGSAQRVARAAAVLRGQPGGWPRER